MSDNHRVSKLTCLVTLGLGLMAGSALADDPAAPPPASTETMGGTGSKIIGVDVVGILPLGDYSNGASFGIGGLARFEYGVSDLLAVTGRAGYIYNLGTPSGVGLAFIPVLVGATYKVGPPGLFVYGELGFTNIRVSVDVMGVSGNSSQTKFSFGAGAGYQTGKIKARVGLFLPGSEDNGTSSTTLYGIMASVGYDIAAL
ncbi:hypothetical protein BH11MYX1_BH11MYX1_04270 [soil metagenome]